MPDSPHLLPPSEEIRKQNVSFPSVPFGIVQEGRGIVWHGPRRYPEGAGMANYIRQTKQGEREPVCTHCKSTDLRTRGFGEGKQRYVCRTCGRGSYGLPSDLRPKCPTCQGAVREQRLPDGRSRYFCPPCGKSFLSEYKSSRPDRDSKNSLRYVHRFAVCLTRQARLCLVEYAQATRRTEPQALRAIFRYVLTGKVFRLGAIRRGGQYLYQRVARDPAAVAMKFPDLRSESAKKSIALVKSGHTKPGFQPTVLSVQQIAVYLDDEAKEGLVYAMHFLGKNHADAARWLLTNVRMPDAAHKESYTRLFPTPQMFPSIKRRSVSELYGRRYDPDWDDD